MAWRQIPHHTFRSPVKRMPRWVRAVLAAKRNLLNTQKEPTQKEEPTNIMVGSCDFMADHIDKHVKQYNFSLTVSFF